MFPTKSLLSLLTVWLFATVCLAEEPSFPQPEKGVELLNQYIVQFNSADDFKEAKNSILDGEEVEVVRYIDTRNIGVYKFSSKKAAAKWRDGGAVGVKYFEADSIAYLDRFSSSSQGSRKLEETTPYGIGHVKAEAIPDDNSGTRKICVVDSGYDMGHEDLPFDDTNTQITGESFVSGYDWSTDEGHHGTHVTGTIAAIGGNDIGVKGVIRNGNLKLHISKVFDVSGSALWSTIIAGFESCGQNGANVVNMSLGGSYYLQSFADAIADAYAAGIVTFASSGNSYGTFYNYPASYPFVLSVGSITESYIRSSFSTYNDKVDLCAPGSSVLSTTPDDNYAYYSGTSMASPHAAGVAALVWSQYPELSHETLINILETTAVDLPLDAPDGYDNEYGHGLVDSEAAYEALLIILTPTVSPAPSNTPSVSSVPSVSKAPSSAPSDFCPIGTIDTTVEIFTDYWYWHTAWDIKDADGAIFASRDFFDFKSKYTLYEDRVCLPVTETLCSGADYTFTIYDSYGDGMVGEGYYKVTVEEEIYVEGGDFGHSESASLCYPASKPPSGAPTVSENPSKPPSPSPSHTPTVSKNPSSPPSPSPSNAPSVSKAPSSTPSVFCPDGIAVKIEIFTDSYPDTYWSINDADGYFVAYGGPFDSSDTLYEEWACLAETETALSCGGPYYTFRISDQSADGICCKYGEGYYKVTIDDKIYAEGGRFTDRASTSLCSCPTGTIEAKVEVLTDFWGAANSWDIKDANDNVVASRSRFNLNSEHTYYSDKVCLAETETCFGGTDYTFTIYDSQGNGLCCDGGYYYENGHYRVIIEEEIYAEGGKFGYSESTTLCKDSSTSCTPYKGTISECSRPENGCFWQDDACHDCSSISDAGWGPSICVQKGCFWNYFSLSCE